MRPHIWIVAVGLLLGGCEGSSGNTEPPGGGPDASKDAAADAQTDASLPDIVTDRGPGTDASGPGDVASEVVPIDAEPGSLALGEPCDDDLQCASGLCWSTSVAKGCTVACASMADCEAYGLLCQSIRQDVRACVPELVPADDDCEGHEACTYPLACREDMGWCSLPECAWDADCPNGEVCETAARRCQPSSCVSSVQCAHPAERCVDGACGPPECESDQDCGGGDDYCHPVQKTCDTPGTCTEEKSCFYNETCTDGLCFPNLCWEACDDPAAACDPATGWCGKPCESAAQCPAGEACGMVSGICYPNTPPLALAAADVGGTPRSAANVTAGAAISLSGAGSVDPEGEPLTYAWTLEVVPEGSALQPASPLGGDQPTLAFTPDTTGLFAVGLRVRDPGGLHSIQAQVVLWAE